MHRPMQSYFHKDFQLKELGHKYEGMRGDKKVELIEAIVGEIDVQVNRQTSTSNNKRQELLFRDKRKSVETGVRSKGTKSSSFCRCAI
jgi:hypothetical protein